MTGPTFSRYVILLAALLLCFSGVASAMRSVGVVQEPVAKQDPKQKSAVVVHKVDRKVVNVVIDKMANGYIKAKDGSTINISGVKVVNNSKSGSRIVMAELFYENGSLVSVIIK